jgi:hypothetical protein
MPWEITIRRGDGLPLGRLDQVMSGISKAFPKVQFYQEPSGMEKLAVLKEQGVEFPDVLRRHYEETPATHLGDYEGDGFSIRFFLGSGGEAATVDAEVRGDTERVYPLLCNLAEANQWVVAECGSSIPFIE